MGLRSRFLIDATRSSLTILTCAGLLGVAACGGGDAAQHSTSAADGRGPAQERLGEGECGVEKFDKALRWQQQSAEAWALQEQTFTQATRQLRKAVRAYRKNKAAGDKPPAIITDLDETIISNAALLARDLQECHDYSDWSTWKQWERRGQPELIPGALEFLRAADAMGVRINYISDRYEENRADTVRALRALDLPQVSQDEDPQNVLLLGPAKEERRKSVQKKQHVLMQLGDSLPDFDGRFKGADVKTQRELVRKNAERFGREWIVLPNPTYGSWEDEPLEAWDAPVQEER